PSRRFLGPVLAGGVATSIAALFDLKIPLVVLGVLPLPPGELDIPITWAFNLVRILVPIGMLVGILRQRATRTAVADAVAAVGADGSGLALGDALRKALGDPALRVLRWDRDADGYRDEQGGLTEAPEPTPASSLEAIDTDGAPLALLV